MSWILGYFGNTDQQKLTSPETPLYSFRDSNLILFAGGNQQTTFFKSNSLNSCWSVAGVGLISTLEEYKVLDENEWNNFLIPIRINLEFFKWAFRCNNLFQ